MTIAQMHVGFLLELKAQGSHEDFEPQEIDVYLNGAIRAFIDERKPLVRENEGALADLRTLIDGASFFAGDQEPHGVYTEVTTAQLDEDFEYPVSGRAQVSGESRRPLLLLPYSLFIDQLSADDHSPVYRRQPATIEGNTLLVISHGSDESLPRIDLTYLRVPAKVSLTGGVDCDLPAHTHASVISRAVDIARQALLARE